MSNPFFHRYEQEIFLANCWNDDCILGLFFMSASLGKAQEFILKTVESSVSGSPSNRSEGLLSTHWTQDYPYNQFCPRDPMNDYSYSYAGYPAHLAVENPQGTAGHNVVVDGYRKTDGKFHINFGYGGSLDNWYSIPDPDFYYGMTKLEGIIVDIIPTSSAVQEFIRQQPLEVYPNPVSDVLIMKNLPCEQVSYSIVNVLGQVVVAGSSDGTISVSGLERGIYFLQVKGGDYQKTAKFVVR